MMSSSESSSFDRSSFDINLAGKVESKARKETSNFVPLKRGLP